MVLPKQPDPVEDVLIENARPLYPIPYRDRLVGDIITADSASRNGLPRDNIDDETPLANLTLDDLSTVEPSFDDVIGRTRHQLYDAGGDRWSNSRDAAQPHQDDVMRDVDALDSQLALGVEVDARQRRARRDSVDSTSTEAILREAEQALHPDETKSQADIEVVERPPGEKHSMKISTFYTPDGRRPTAQPQFPHRTRNGTKTKTITRPRLTSVTVRSLGPIRCVVWPAIVVRQTG